MKNKLLWGIYIAYLLISGCAISHHGPWTDEVNSWNIAKGSHTYADLISNTRYEGHPPGWFTILWSISRFTHNVAYMKTAQWLIAAMVVYMILFLSPFPLFTKILIPFGYFFLFEYAVFSRDYAMGVLLACCICYILTKDLKYKPLLYYTLLFCLTNTHLLGLILAASLHLYFLLWTREQRPSVNRAAPARRIGVHILLGVIVSLPAVYFIFPPSDSMLNNNFWHNKITVSQLAALNEIPLRAFLPIPAWWNFHFWNTEFLLEAKNTHHFLSFANPLVSIGILALGALILRRSPKSLALFIANVLLTALVAVVVQPLTSARYSGFIFIAFIAAWWLYCYERPVTALNSRPVNMLLLVQLTAGAFAVTKGILFPFSNLYRVNELVNEVPAGYRLVTDYWTMSGYVTFMDTPAYCIDTRKEMSFIVWGADIPAIHNDPARYTGGLNDLFSRQHIDTVYMVTIAPVQQLFSTDTQLSGSFLITLVDKREGAIEKGSNLYLYRISSKKATLSPGPYVIQ
jgi:hypothetical protein